MHRIFSKLLRKMTVIQVLRFVKMTDVEKEDERQAIQYLNSDPKYGIEECCSNGMITDEDKYRGKVHDTCLNENIILTNVIDNVTKIFSKEILFRNSKECYQMELDFLHLRYQW